MPKREEESQQEKGVGKSQNLCMNRNITQPQGTLTRREKKKSISRAVNILERTEKELWQNR